jgi:hypothetical protein
VTKFEHDVDEKSTLTLRQLTRPVLGIPLHPARRQTTIARIARKLDEERKKQSDKKKEPIAG